MNALFAADMPAYPMAHGGGADGRWTAEAAYRLRLPVFRGRFTGSPHVGYGVSGPGRDISVSLRLAPAEGGPDLSLTVLATRRESPAAPAEHGGSLQIETRW